MRFRTCTRDAKHSLGTRLEFPRYVPKFSGSSIHKLTAPAAPWP